MLFCISQFLVTWFQGIQQEGIIPRGTSMMLSHNYAFGRMRGIITALVKVTTPVQWRRKYHMGRKGLFLENILLSNLTYYTMKSYIPHLYIFRATNIPAGFSNKLSQFVGGMKRNMEKERQYIGINIEEGEFFNFTLSVLGWSWWVRI